MSNLSPSTLALLRAAKHDAPSKHSRTAIWGGVTSGLITHTPLHISPQSAAGQGVSSAAPPPVAASAAPAAVATKGIATAAGLTGMKGAFIGALFGSAISIGVATFMLRTKPAPTPQNEIPRGPLSAQVAQSNPGTNAQPNNAPNNATASAAAANAATTNTTEIDALPISTNAGSTVNTAGSTGSSTSTNGNMSHATTSLTAPSSTDDTTSRATKKKSTSSSDQNLSPDESLSRETALVAEARRDLQNGDAAAALKAARTARSLDARQFEPEEMKQEAAALRLLGRDTEAAKIESQRRTMYPNTL
jgi:hypothetical protein